MSYQQAVLEAVPPCARYLEFRLVSVDAARSVLEKLVASWCTDDVIGIGKPLLNALGASQDGLSEFPTLTATGVSIPVTQGDLWIWVRADQPGEVFRRSRALRVALAPAFTLLDETNAFCFDGGRDLSGYEDGTENPTGNDAIAAAFDESGASFVAVQRWQHDLEKFESHSDRERDNIIGRRLSDNVELEDSPPSAHVKRTAQEDFEPEAFVVRRSMPWSDGRGEGLMFVAFGCSHEPFEAQMRRMAGLDDGIIDALFSFSTPVTGAYYWCPPLTDSKLILNL